jgi:uncharacterized protein (DUF486 family)
MNKYVVGAYLLLSSLVAQAEQWTETQKTLAASYLIAHVIDWGQTRYIAQTPDKSTEYNSILGSHPSMAKVNTYFLLTPVLWYYALDNIPQYRTAALTVLNLVQIGVVAHNYHVGIKVSF